MLVSVIVGVYSLSIATLSSDLGYDVISFVTFCSGGEKVQLSVLSLTTPVLADEEDGAWTHRV